MHGWARQLGPDHGQDALNTLPIWTSYELISGYSQFHSEYPCFTGHVHWRAKYPEMP
jgi:hypothetical protein